jgi:ubiquinone/menaquinone biosynthesis C-methylase UbiE
MTFNVAAEAYDSFMGRYSMPLAPLFADFAGVTSGERVLDVGCGPGALTRELVGRLGAGSVAAVDPSEPFVEAVRERLPGVRVEQASAERLPFPDESFDRVMAQLVVHFMADPVDGLAEMARVACPDSVVAACVWDHAGDKGPLGTFWRAARVLDTGVHDESRFAGAREGHLAELFADAGLREIDSTLLTVRIEHQTFDEWWKPFTLGVGPAGAYTAGLDADRQTRLRELCRERLPDEPIVVTAGAWAAKGRV